MKYAALSLLSVLLVVASEARAGSSHAQTPAGDIVATAVEAGDFQVLAAALQQADLVEALQGPGPFTVFAPTDEAFARLPEGTVASLLRPENRERLRRILTYHVVPGRVLSGDLLGAATATSLEGSPLPIGLRVGNASVVKADIVCSNGVIHVIDAVLLPPEATAPALDVMTLLRAAIEKGAPRYNHGDHAGCRDVYTAAAKRLVSHRDALGELHRAHLERVLARPKADAGEQAWALRHAFDRIASDMSFEPRMEASMPPGFPAPGPVGRVVVKEYPRYRAARADGGNSFWTLFQHIKKNDVEMTTPVEMTMDASSMRPVDMAFLYEGPRQGTTGQQGPVEVLDVEPRTVLSIGMRGARSTEDIERAKAAIESRLAQDGWRASGAWRLLGYNSPMVRGEMRFWELQLPVER